MLNEQDLSQIQAMGITKEMVENQIHRFQTGFPYLKLRSAATIGNGILKLTDKQEREAIKLWNDYRKAGGSIAKFVPASGAASRMFKNLYAFVKSSEEVEQNAFIATFFNQIENFPFFDELNSCCKRLYKADIKQLTASGRHRDVLKALLDANGMNYGNLPKGLLLFHKIHGQSIHTPVEEHLEECAQYASTANHEAHIHFTISPEHKTLFEHLFAQKKEHYEEVWGVNYDITTSTQDLSTNTIAVNPDNTPYRDSEGKLFFRPAGHGALLKNLNALDANVVFIKNIDNVVPSKYRSVTIKYKKVLAGRLVKIKRQINEYLTKLEARNYDAKDLSAMLAFLQSELCTYSDNVPATDAETLAKYLKLKFNRPIRVCGVVKNEGEPGGGPYLAYNKDGSYSPQILESAQINAADPAAVEMMKSCTHFNPVALVCDIKDYKGNKFNLADFVDPDTGLISSKSIGGQEVKALELPGLWNGSMSDWNTVFVEVPIDTFNPVKTVNDLLRKQHQG